MMAIVDCNSFYCSCERLFRPDLWSRPVVVLSNNDGCIIARSDEAKALGIDMAGPYYQQRHTLQQHDVAVFSSNYGLYGDLSMRVMDTLRDTMPPGTVEVYSVDEAFLDISHVSADAYAGFAMQLRQTVESWTGIRVSVGVAPSKVLAKVANRLAKKDKKGSGCVMVLDSEEGIRHALEGLEVGEVWGVGRRYASKLKEQYGINTAWQLRHMPEEWARRNMGGIVGVRLLRELNGKACIPMKDPLETKKMISTTRMFGKAVYALKDLKEAVSTYVARAAEKLRRQGYAAGSLDVFVVTNGQEGDPYAYDPKSDHRYKRLEQASAFTNELIAEALPLVEQLFRPGSKYLKAGVVLGDLVPDKQVQQGLFSMPRTGGSRQLMEAVDNLNFSMRNDVVRYASSGQVRHWRMRQDMRSRRYTTRWDELYEVG